jgi:hypothetical protein
VTWALYSVLIGLVAAQWLGHEPLLAMVVGVVIGIAAGFVIDRILMVRSRRRGVIPVALMNAAPTTDAATAPSGTAVASTPGDVGATSGSGVASAPGETDAASGTTAGGAGSLPR